MLRLILIAALAFIPFTPAGAHEGHDVPGQVKSRHGGIVKTGKQMHMEMLALDGKVQFFPFPHDNETLDLNKLKVTATIKFPKGKPVDMPLQKETNSFSGTYKLEGSYRADIEVSLDYGGKKDKFKFLVEE